MLAQSCVFPLQQQSQVVPSSMKKRAVVRPVVAISEFDKLESSNLFIDDLTVCKLKQALRLRELPVNGNRGVLLHRLRQAVEQQKQKEREQYERGLDLHGMPCVPLAKQKTKRRFGNKIFSQLSQSLMFAIAECLGMGGVLHLARVNRDMQRMFSMAITGPPSPYMLVYPRLSVCAKQRQLTAAQLKSVFQRMVGLKAVSLTSRHLTPLALTVLGQRATGLRALSVDLRVCDRFDDVLQVIAVAHSCAHLRHLELLVPSRTEETWDWLRLVEPIYQLHQLHELSWAGSRYVPQALLEATPNLRLLHLDCSDDVVPRNIGRLTHLTELTLGSGVDKGLQWLSGCSALRKLDLRIDFEQMMPAFVVNTLEELCLRGRLPEEDTPRSLASCFPNLRKLSLRNIYGGDESTPRLLAFPFVRELHGEVDFKSPFFELLKVIVEQPDFMPGLERIVMTRCLSNYFIFSSNKAIADVVEELRSARCKLEVIRPSSSTS